MIISVDSKNYEKDYLKMLDSVNDTTSAEFIYYCETLYKAPDGEYILEVSWQLNPWWYEDELAEGILPEKAMRPKTEYKRLSMEEANDWLGITAGM